MSEQEVEAINCRCGGKPSNPKKYKDCPDRWIIECTIKGCKANNISQTRINTIVGWNRLSSSFYR